MSYRRRAEVSSEERALDLVRLAFRREEGSEVRRRVTQRRVDERTEQGGALRPVLGGQQAPRPCLLACIPTEGPRLPILSPPMVTVPGEHLTASSVPLTRQARGTRCHTIAPLVLLFARQRTSSREPRGRCHTGAGVKPLWCE